MSEADDHIIVTLGGVKGSGKDTVGALMMKSLGLYRRHSFAAPLKQMAAKAFPQLTAEQLWGSSSAREEPIDVPLRGLDPRNGERMARTLSDDEAGEHTGWIASDGTIYPTHLNARIVLQTLGTEWGRRLHDNIWVDAALGHCEVEGPNDNWVITDQRFPNEALVARERGAVTVKLLRGWYEAKDRFEAAGVLRDGKIIEDVLTGMAGQDFHPSELLMFTIPEHHYDYVLDNRVDLDQLPGLVARLVEEIHHSASHWRRARNFAEEMTERKGRRPTVAPMRIGL